MTKLQNFRESWASADSTMSCACEMRVAVSCRRVCGVLCGCNDALAARLIPQIFPKLVLMRKICWISTLTFFVIIRKSLSVSALLMVGVAKSATTVHFSLMLILSFFLLPGHVGTCGNVSLTSLLSGLDEVGKRLFKTCVSKCEQKHYVCGPQVEHWK